MSKIGEFLKDVWQEIKDFFTGRNFIHKHADTIIDILEDVKQAVDSPVADVVTSFIKGRWDDVALELARDGLSLAITKLKMVDDFNDCLERDSIEDQLNCIFKRISKYSNLKKNQVYLETAKELLLVILKKKGIEPSEDDLEDIIEGHYKTRKLAEELAK